MDFTFDEEQRLAAQSLRDLLTDHCQGSDLRRAADARDLPSFEAACATRRARLAELGLTGALVPAEQGGLGLGVVDFVLLAEEAGRAALPEPLIDVEGVAHPLLAALVWAAPGELGDRTLQETLAGSALVLSAAPAPGAAPVRSAAPGTTMLANAAFAQYFLLGRSDDELALYRASDISLTHRESVDPLRRLSEIALTDAKPIALVTGSAAASAWQAARARSTVLNAAQLLGLGSRMLEIAVAYSLERKQFGKAIGSNQAVKHSLADVMVKLEFARPVVYAAAATLAPVRVAHAAVAAADAADRAARAAIQVHGAMGYSWEVDLQFYAKRAWALAGLNGGRSAQFLALHQSLLRGELEAQWA